MIDLNPFDAAISYISHRKERKLKESEYLQSIADEARKLAGIWSEIVIEIEEDNQKSIGEILEGKPISYSRIQLCNSDPRHNLEAFYRNISSTLGAKYNDDVNSIVFHIGNLLTRRNLLKSELEKELSSMKNKVFFDSSNHTINLNSLHELAEALHKEAAALNIRAQEFKLK